LTPILHTPSTHHEIHHPPRHHHHFPHRLAFQQFGDLGVFAGRGFEGLPVGARLMLLDRRGEDVAVELPGGGEAAVPGDRCDVREDNVSPRLERVIENALKLLGTDYVWGGNTSDGIDCSGLMQVAFAAEGINLPRDSSQQIHLGSLTATRWCREGLRRGDTLYFLGQTGKISHTAIYLGDGEYLEAVRPEVRRTSFNPRDENFHAGRNASFCFAKRLLE
jgi:cell wall-associated NlpC family hydrolase